MQTDDVSVFIPHEVDVRELLGVRDQHLRFLEERFSALLILRKRTLSIRAEKPAAQRLKHVLEQLISDIQETGSLSFEELKLRCEQSFEDVDATGSSAKEPKIPVLYTSYRGLAIRPKTPGQLRYVEAIQNNTICFGTGVAGTGKTYLACALALSALEKDEVSRIVLVRPVVEAGESLGFLPGSFEEKLDPYVRPLYDALFDLASPEKIQKMQSLSQIEIAPLAFMRGRTFNNSFVILDEAQNTNPQQMKMFLTRLGFSSKFVITGDSSQRDLSSESGLVTAQRILAPLDDVACIELGSKDIVRNSLVSKIVDAYARYESRQEKDVSCSQ